MNPLSQHGLNRWTFLLCACILLAAFGGCKEPAPKIEGKVLERTDEEISESYSLNSPASDPRFVPIRNATISVEVRKSAGNLILSTTKSGPNGSFLLELPDQLPAGSVLIVSTDDHEPFVKQLDERPPGYLVLTFVLKKKKKA
ncbi:MAG: hypothetical protein U0792_03980 [Gemmataceae bacterium]